MSCFLTSEFYGDKRQSLLKGVDDDALLVLFAGEALRKTADAYYACFPSRNFVYLTGLGEANAQYMILVARKQGKHIEELLFAPPSDELTERWNGRRMRPEEIAAISGIRDVRPLDAFLPYIHTAVTTDNVGCMYLDLYRHKADEPDDTALRFSRRMKEYYPQLQLRNVTPLLRSLRTIKSDCEIAAMKQAMTVTREGVLAMMRGTRSDMREYHLKAMFDKALTDRGVIAPAFPPIIASGSNNFYIHYDTYNGLISDGEMILVDVGAIWNYLCNDVSRTWPVNGKFTDKQRALYECAYETSEYMFSIIKPGMPMADVDLTARRHCYEKLNKLGLVDSYDEVSKLIWHGGAHHVGFDVHDAVDMSRPVSPGMVFCVDIGIYCQEWGIGFRLEDNCLVTQSGCENLSASIPRNVAEIERVLAR